MVPEMSLFSFCRVCSYLQNAQAEFGLNMSTLIKNKRTLYNFMNGFRDINKM